MAAPPLGAPESNDGENDYKSFLSIFFQSRGTSQILIVSTLAAVGAGSVIGLVRPRPKSQEEDV